MARTHWLLALGALATAPAAHGFGGAYLTRAGETATSSATRIAISHQQGRTTLTVTSRYDGTPGRIAVALPLPVDVDVSEIRVIAPEFFARIDRFTAPRTEAIQCSDLIARTYFSTAPGCTSFEPSEPPPALDEEADDALFEPFTWADVPYQFAVLPPDDVDAWLTANELLPAPGMDAVLEGWQAAGLHVFLARTDDPRPANGWLPPVQIPYPDPTLELPLLLGAGGARGSLHDLVVYTLTDPADGELLVENYPQAWSEDECMPSPGSEDFGEAWDEALSSVLPGIPLPAWLVEHGGRADRCTPCADPSLLDYELRDFGFEGEPAEAWIGRLHMRYRPSSLDEDIQLTWSPDTLDSVVRFHPYDTDLEFAVPVCGLGLIDNPGVCPELELPGASSGCATGARTWPTGLALLAVLALVRRRTAPLVLLAAPIGARAADGPILTADGAVGLLSSVRVLPDDAEGGAPALLRAPHLGLDARVHVVQLPRLSIGAAAGSSAWSGRAAKGSLLRFTSVEPWLAVDGRHGAPGERAIAPWLRYGVGAALSIVSANVWNETHTSLGARLHLGSGIWIGRGPVQASVGLMGSLIPRTDAYVVELDPRTGIPGWSERLGGATVALTGGIALP